MNNVSDCLAILQSPGTNIMSALLVFLKLLPPEENDCDNATSDGTVVLHLPVSIFMTVLSVVELLS